tara:strand:+ start:752 stop:1768 length:1017 start_codon:yes stop_codon:yes gene_type:complete
MLQFEHIEYLNLFFLLIPLIGLFVWYILWKRKAISSFAKKETLFSRLSEGQSNFKQYVKFFFVLLGFLAIVIALINPKIGTKFEAVKREGVDVMIAIDVSKSMNATDIQPSRMLKARQFVSNLINEMSNDRIGLIVFAGNAYLQMPLTVDYSATKMFLKQVNTDLVPTQGTAIGDAVELAERSYPKEQKNQKVLLVISDGENHEGNAEDAIANANENGIKVITIGVGTKKGGPIPIGNRGDFKKDSEGNIVVTKLNEDMLRDLSKEANGTYHHINDKNITASIIDELGSLDGKVFEEKVITDYKQHFQVFLFIAFILLLIEFLISFRKSKFSINFFKK